MQELIYIVSYTNVSGPKSDYLKLLTLLPDGTISTFNYFNSAPLEESFYSYKVKKNGDFLNLTLLEMKGTDLELFTSSQRETYLRVYRTLPTAFQRKVEEVYSLFETLCTNKGYSDFAEVCKPYLTTLLKDFTKFPAGYRQHHTQKGGLLTHVYEVLSFYNSLACNELTPLSKEEAVAGAVACLLHDAGKVFEYSVTSDGQFQYVIVNTRSPHTVTSVKFLNKLISTHPHELWKVIRSSVEHCIVSHHGLKDWQSPLSPQTLTAYLVHTADMLSGQTYKSCTLDPHKDILEFPYSRR